MSHSLQSRLRAVVICPEAELRREFHQAMEPFSALVELLAEYDEYPNETQLARLLRVHCPQIVFVSFHYAEDARDLMSGLRREARELPVIGLGGQNGEVDLGLLRETVHLGLHDFLVRPFQHEAVQECLRSVKQHLEEAPATLHFTDHLYGFLPARPGVGATTLAINTAAAFQRHGTAALLLDMDMSCGLVRFLLRLGQQHAVADAVLYASELDEPTWKRLVDRTLPIDVLHSGRVNPQAQIHAGQLEALIDYTRRQYGALCFDLSGNFEAYSVQVLEDSKHILLVTTPEPGAVHLAREKLAFLESMGLRSRVKLLVNRADQSLGVDQDGIASVLRIPIFHCFHNDYAAVNEAVRRGEFVARDSILGSDCDAFVTKLLNAPSVGWSAERVVEPIPQTLEKEPDAHIPV